MTENEKPKEPTMTRTEQKRRARETRQKRLNTCATRVGTEKQQKYIRFLVARAGLTDERVAEIVGAYRNKTSPELGKPHCKQISELTINQMGELIDDLVKLAIVNTTIMYWEA